MPSIRKSVISPPPGVMPTDDSSWSFWVKWLDTLRIRAGGNGTPFIIPAYTVATLPSANRWNDKDTTGTGQFGSIVFVIDDNTGPLLAFANGSNWKRCNDPTVTVI